MTWCLRLLSHATNLVLFKSKHCQKFASNEEFSNRENNLNNFLGRLDIDSWEWRNERKKSIKCDIVRFWRVWLLSHFHVKTPRHDKNCKAVNFKSTIYVHFWLYFFSFILVILMLITFWVSAKYKESKKYFFHINWNK